MKTSSGETRRRAKRTESGHVSSRRISRSVAEARSDVLDAVKVELDGPAPIELWRRSMVERSLPVLLAMGTVPLGWVAAELLIDGRTAPGCALATLALLQGLAAAFGAALEERGEAAAEAEGADGGISRWSAIRLALLLSGPGALAAVTIALGDSGASCLVMTALALFTCLLVGRREGLVTLGIGAFLILASSILQASGFAPIVRFDRPELVPALPRSLIIFLIHGGGLLVVSARLGSLLQRSFVEGAELNGALQERVQERDTVLLEREKLESRLRQTQKLEALGQLASGVAHDFNNLLTVIIGYADLAGARLDEHNPTQRYIRDIRESGQRAHELTRRMLAFSRVDDQSFAPADLNELMRNIQRLLNRLLGEPIKQTLDLEPAPCMVLGDKSQLEQVVINLALNARDAMQGGGELQFETRHVTLGASEGVEPGSYVRLRVTDNGPGISEQDLDRIFEPFFTTKPIGEGTGLGLSTVHAIVRQHGGFVAVTSSPGQGACFEVLLPAIEQAVDETTAKPDPEALPPGRERILLVEDQAGVLRLATMLLSSLGYDVIPCSGPEEALEHDVISEEIDLLLTDVVMPGMNGRELYATISSWSPDLRVLFMSGYTSGIFGRDEIKSDGFEVLQKPFTKEVLARRVRAALERSRMERESVRGGC